MLKRLVAASVIAASMSFGVSNQAVSAPIDFIDNGNYTTDTISGLDWLDLTETVGQSYNVVNYLRGDGLQFEGWRYANQNDFVGLLKNWTGIDTPVRIKTDYPEDGSSVDGLVDLLGATVSGNNQRLTFGFLSDQFITHTRNQFVALIADNDEPGIMDSANSFYSYYPGYSSSPGFGSYLIRDTEYVLSTVPLPGALPAFLGGIALIGLVNRKKRQQAT